MLSEAQDSVSVYITTEGMHVLCFYSTLSESLKFTDCMFHELQSVL